MNKEPPWFGHLWEKHCYDKMTMIHLTLTINPNTDIIIDTQKCSNHLKEDNIHIQQNIDIALRKSTNYNNNPYTRFYDKNPHNLRPPIFSNNPTKSNKPKIPASGQFAQDVIHLINQKQGAIIRHIFARRFVRKWKRMCRDIGYKNVKPKIIYHWTSEHNFKSIIENGLKVIDGELIKNKTDIWFYGKGIYTNIC